MPHPETDAVRIQAERSANREHSVPLYLTSSFCFDDAEQARAVFAGEADANIYSRFSNPNTDEFVAKMCALEGAEDGVAFATGMSAVFGAMAGLLRSGDHILAGRAIFGSTHQLLTTLLPRWGITCTYADTDAQERWGEFVQPNTRMVFVETPSNPGLDLIDLEMVGRLARERELILCVDNCFATPMVQRPIDFGADLVVHSATKFIDGQGRVLGGVAVGRKELIEHLRFFVRHTGPAMSPFNAWVLSKSIETLSVRMQRHAASAMELALRLEGHAALKSVRYPFLESHPQHALARRQMRTGGGMITIELAGGFDEARRFIDALRIVSITSNLGDTRTIVTHPASTTHAKLGEEERAAVGITPGLVRISVGLEHVDDLIDDILQALDAAR